MFNISIAIQLIPDPEVYISSKQDSVLANPYKLSRKLPIRNLTPREKTIMNEAPAIPLKPRAQ